jgi:transposase InsO family protein
MGIDLAGSDMKEKIRYWLVIMDCLTKYTIVKKFVNMPNTNKILSTLSVLWQQVGKPLGIETDYGQQFRSREWKEALKT